MNDTVTIHSREWKRSDIAEQIEFCRSLSLQLQRWHTSPAQVRSGFRHEHCEICWWTLFESEDPDNSSGYTDGYRWVCRECYQQFLAPNSSATGKQAQHSSTSNAHQQRLQ